MAGVDSLNAAASFLLLSRRGRAEDVAEHLASWHSDSDLRDDYLSIGGWLQFLCDELVRPEPDAKGRIRVVSPPAGISLDDYTRAMRAFGYGTAGPSIDFGQTQLQVQHRQPQREEGNAPVPDPKGLDREPKQDDQGKAVPRESENQSTQRAENRVSAPTDAAIMAYRLKWILGMGKQMEIAEKLTRELGRPVSQGQVSRWLKQTEAFVEAGGVLPQIQPLSRNKPTPIDPERIDLGRRQDGRAKRQRPRRDPDGDD
jgi:hypothetical protein